MNKAALKLYLAALVFLSSFFMFNPSFVEGASMYLFPPSGTYTVGSAFSVNVKVDTGGNAINAAEGVLVFNPKELEIISVNKATSFFTLWTKEPSFSNSAGRIEFGGGTQNSFSGTNGTIMTVVLKPKASASSQVNFSSGSILAADGLGTNVLRSMQGGIYTSIVKPTSLDIGEPKDNIPVTSEIPVKTGTTISIEAPVAPAISSETHPDENAWYSNSSPKVTWTVPAEITGIRASMDNKLGSLPMVVNNVKTTSKEFKDIENGIWYFHLQFSNARGWGSVAHRKIMIDTLPPGPFSVVADYNGDDKNPAPFLIFKAEDKISGISFYEVRVDQGEPAKIEPEILLDTPFQVKPLAPGSHTAIVKAVDKAGNATLGAAEFEIMPLECPLIKEIPQSIAQGDNIEIKGTSAYPNATLTLMLKKDNEDPVSHAILADESGSWSFKCGDKLTAGRYEAWLSLTDKRGGQSGECQRMNFVVARPFMTKIGSLIINYSSIIMLLVVLVALATAILFYALYRMLLWRNRLRGNTARADRVVLESFKMLRNKVQKEVEYFDSLPGLSQREKETRDRLHKVLNEAEKGIRRKIDNINE